MTPGPWPHRPARRPARPAGASLLAAQTITTGSDTPFDWAHWLRATERRRRLVAQADPRGFKTFWAGYFLSATDASFRLEGLDLPRADLAAALAPGGRARALRSRQQQRVRNHVAILRHLEALLRRGGTLKSADVVRWYTSVACGLSTTRFDEPTAARLEGVVRQINSPHLRLRPAVQGIARLHRQTLADPVVPGFNGILARLLLRYHLGRCSLPPVMFVPDVDKDLGLLDEQRLLRRLLDLIDQSYAALLAKAG
jgi:hypothetical protein